MIRFESQELAEELGGRLVGHRRVRLRERVDELHDAVVVGDHVALIGVVDGPEGLGLALGEVERRRHHQFLVRPRLLAEDLHGVRRLVLRARDPGHEGNQEGSDHQYASISMSHGCPLPPGVARSFTLAAPVRAAVWGRAHGGYIRLWSYAGRLEGVGPCP